MNYSDARQDLVDWLRSQLIGPPDSDLNGISPLERFPTGVLHPIEQGVTGIDPASGADDPEGLHDASFDESAPVGDETGSKESAQPAVRRRYVPPSSVGFSFCIQGEARLLITATATCYKDAGHRDSPCKYVREEYCRKPLEEQSHTWKSGSAPGWEFWKDENSASRAGIDVRVRPHASGVIFTVTLFNRRKLDPYLKGRQRRRNRIENSLFEAKLECIVESGQLVEYPRVDPSLLTDEELELELQYQGRHIFAVGHGAAVDWNVENGKCACIWSDFFPAVEVPLVSVESSGRHGEALTINNLAQKLPFGALEDFVAAYDDWIAQQKEQSVRLQDSIQHAASVRMCKRMEVAHQRMREGLRFLRKDELANKAFRVANKAMVMQMCRTREVAGKQVDPDSFRWRPFQLAFLLTAMKSTALEDDEFRDTLDLIWFPTGGGKSEAYLGLIAFLIVWRRLKYGVEGGGTVAIMRYTLRLLTRQQFERAGAVLFALELLRRDKPDLLGLEPIQIGIWVGSAICPNQFQVALEQVEGIRKGKPDARQKLLVDRCLWCESELDVCGYNSSLREFHFHCTNPECEFGSDERPLPCNVVDEALYQSPPTLLVATVDKFARLAWEPHASSFFGSEIPGKGLTRAPELVIQDELHLITGALGSVVGLYEAGLDTLLRCRGVHPKYIASTATIRMAKEQVKRLYARDVAVFPPPGLSCDDSWFARSDTSRPGRLYVGYLAPMLDQSHCLAPLAASLLAAPEAVFRGEIEADGLLDAWWTIIVFHGSLKAVGSSHNCFMTDVREFGRRIYGELIERERSKNKSEVSSAGNFNERYTNPQIEQLTSQKSVRENANTFKRLSLSREHNDCLDSVLATNMISVGLDVSRLGLMVVNGQPLTTAEYIQATSRVGRAEVPGIVVTNYFRHQARSLSHYESFRPYHESFYRFVEPSSVTPFTYPVRSRALHAALVIAIRHAFPQLNENALAGKFNPDAGEVKEIIDTLKTRCTNAASDVRADELTKHIDSIVSQWSDEVRRCEDQKRQLNYYSQDKKFNAERLLFSHGEKNPGLWLTLHSMRNVEDSGMFKIDG